MRRGEKLRQFFKHLNLTILANLTLFGIFIVVGAYYLMQINDLAITGYNIRDYEKEISQLENEIHDLELKLAQKQSIYEVHKKIENSNLNLVAVDNVVYYKAQNMAMR